MKSRLRDVVIEMNDNAERMSGVESEENSPLAEEQLDAEIPSGNSNHHRKTESGATTATTSSRRQSTEYSGEWKIFGERLPRSEVMYICTIFIVFVVICVSLVNLSLNNGKSEMWVSFLSLAFGVILPHPKIKSKYPGMKRFASTSS